MLFKSCHVSFLSVDVVLVQEKVLFFLLFVILPVVPEVTRFLVIFSESFLEVMGKDVMSSECNSKQDNTIIRRVMKSVRYLQETYLT